MVLPAAHELLQAPTDRLQVSQQTHTPRARMKATGHQAHPQHAVIVLLLDAGQDARREVVLHGLAVVVVQVLAPVVWGLLRAHRVDRPAARAVREWGVNGAAEGVLLIAASVWRVCYVLRVGGAHV